MREAFAGFKTSFIPAATGRTARRYRLLVLDGDRSHLTPQFDRECSEKSIISI